VSSHDPGRVRPAEGARLGLRWRRYATATVVATFAAALSLAIVAALGGQLIPASSQWMPGPVGTPGGVSPLATVSPTPISPSTAPPSLRPTPVKVAIFGDSQGTALYATRPKSVSKYLQLSDESISACGTLRGRVVSRSGERFDLVSACPNWLAAWRADAKRVKPAIALVIVGAWDVFDLKTKDTTLTFATAQWDANFLATLRTGISAIRESGAQVALAELPCYRPRKTNPRPPGWWPERGDDDRTRHVNELLRQAADGVHVFTVAPPSAFCADRAIGDNLKYRYDGVHYLQPGAKVYLDAMIPQLLTLPS
jgi:hypothetical protein